MQEAEQDFMSELAALTRVPLTVKKKPSKRSKPGGWYYPELLKNPQHIITKSVQILQYNTLEFQERFFISAISLTGM